MTRAEAITAEIRRYVDAAAHHQRHLAHIRLETLHRLRDNPEHDGHQHHADDCDGDRMFGDDHCCGQPTAVTS